MSRDADGTELLMQSLMGSSRSPLSQPPTVNVSSLLSERRCRSTMWRQACSTRGTTWAARCLTATAKCSPASLWRSWMVRPFKSFDILKTQRSQFLQDGLKSIFIDFRSFSLLGARLSELQPTAALLCFFCFTSAIVKSGGRAALQCRWRRKNAFGGANRAADKFMINRLERHASLRFKQTSWGQKKRAAGGKMERKQTENSPSNDFKRSQRRTSPTCYSTYPYPGF